MRAPGLHPKTLGASCATHPRINSLALIPCPLLHCQPFSVDGHGSYLFVKHTSIPVKWATLNPRLFCCSHVSDIGALGQRSYPRSARIAIDRRRPQRLSWWPLGGIEPRSREQRCPVRGRRRARRLLNLRRNCDELREVTARIESDQCHPRHIQRRVVRPYGSRHHGFIRRGAMRIEWPWAAAIPKHERPGVEVVPACLRPVVFLDIA